MEGSKRASVRKWYLNQDLKDTRHLPGEFLGWRIPSTCRALLWVRAWFLKRRENKPAKVTISRVRKKNSNKAREIGRR